VNSVTFLTVLAHTPLRLWHPDSQEKPETGYMGKAFKFDLGGSPPPGEKRSREEVLRDVRLAIAQANNYGRATRQQGSNPYDSKLGRPQRDIWAGKKRTS
jgi:hypothetical protein